MFINLMMNGFQWLKINIELILQLTIASATLLLLSYFSLLSTMVLGFVLAACAAIYTIKTVFLQKKLSSFKLSK